jgi:hypothetical protein
MKRLSREAFGQAQTFLKTQARPLEGALFAYRFEGAAARKVLSELAGFQNEDGGFGQALEPDLRTPSSSALATGIGLRLLKELKCAADHKMVQGAVEYLRSTFDQQHQVWRVTPADTNEYPHAGWWHDEDGSLARTFDGFRIIPRAELVGLLHHFSAAVPAQWLDAVTEDTVSYIETVAALGTGGGDDLASALSLAETEALPRPFKERLVSRIRAVVPQVVNRRPQEWATYCITPLKVAPSPRSLVADLLWDDLQVQLDYEIEHQSAAGTWDPVWTWEDLYPEAWAQAKLEWRGHLTLEALTVLRAFGRVEI